MFRTNYYGVGRAQWWAVGVGLFNGPGGGDVTLHLAPLKLTFRVFKPTVCAGLDLGAAVYNRPWRAEENRLLAYLPRPFIRVGVNIIAVGIDIDLSI